MLRLKNNVYAILFSQNRDRKHATKTRRKKKKKKQSPLIKQTLPHVLSFN